MNKKAEPLWNGFDETDPEMYHDCTRPIPKVNSWDIFKSILRNGLNKIRYIWRTLYGK